MSNDNFFESLTKLVPELALAKCEARLQESLQEHAELLSKLDATPLGDRQQAHQIRLEINQGEMFRRRLRLALTRYRGEAARLEGHHLFTEGVRVVCGEEALRQVQVWMKAEQRRRRAAKGG